LGARRWQAEIVAPILTTALLEKEPLELAEAETENKNGEEGAAESN
jgi:hypothetical protein